MPGHDVGCGGWGVGVLVGVGFGFRTIDGHSSYSRTRKSLISWEEGKQKKHKKTKKNQKKLVFFFSWEKCKMGGMVSHRIALR